MLPLEIMYSTVIRIVGTGFFSHSKHTLWLSNKKLACQNPGKEFIDKLLSVLTELSVFIFLKD